MSRKAREGVFRVKSIAVDLGGEGDADGHPRDPGVLAGPAARRRGPGRAIRQNLFWAFAYTVVGIPLAAVGLFGAYGPLIAALAMSLSSVTVVPRSSLLAGLDLDRES